MRSWHRARSTRRWSSRSSPTDSGRRRTGRRAEHARRHARAAEVDDLPAGSPMTSWSPTMTVGGVPCVVVTRARHRRRPAPSCSSTVAVTSGCGRTPTSPSRSRWCGRRGCRCVSVDYRRAPEHPYPAPVDDLVAVYGALLADGDPPTRIAFAGDSAGGGLVIAGLVAAPRRRRSPLPAAGVSISPWTDLAVTGASADIADDPIVSGDGTADDGRRVPRGRRSDGRPRRRRCTPTSGASHPCSSRSGRASRCSTTPAGSSDAPASTGST